MTRQIAVSILVLLAGCAPNLTSDSSTARDTRPAQERVLDELVGFGQGTTGGAGGPIVEVTNLQDSGPGSLREAATAPGPAWIRFYNGGSYMWVHHCDLSNGGDGAFDATEGVTNITVSYTHIFDHDKAMLIGAGSDSGDGASMRWTAHHNWYDNTVQRLPFIRFGRAHSFNNLYMWKHGTAMSARIPPAQMLVENSVFMPQTHVGHKLITEASNRGAARLRGNLERPLKGDVIEYTEYLPDTVFDPTESYAYTLETADDALIDRLQVEAGWQAVPFPE